MAAGPRTASPTVASPTTASRALRGRARAKVVPTGVARGVVAASPVLAGPGGGASGGKRSQEEIDLAKAYAIRAQKEKQERIDAEKAKQEAARIRREARAKFDALIEGKAVNAAEAEHPRHFEYGGKIKRVYCTEDQIKQLNAGELWVGQQKGRYLLLPIALLAEAKAVFPDGIALEVDPNATREEDPYADPQYQVPDDLIW
ncbi:DUF2058 family protein [Alkalisalibacterium limincola]|uniref:DUF2058 family protein n=1 Tax=Alkalisalibacterium limincola TaxID=2699169 RepID=A0A5C8KII5_9GAMM|nr:DUF2058 family protein [Alkalisalibacterium limincola]